MPACGRECITRASRSPILNVSPSGKQPVPLRSVAGEVGPVVDLFPDPLDLHDMFADAVGAGAGLECRRRPEKWSARDAQGDPFERQIMARDMIEQAICIRRRRRT